MLTHQELKKGHLADSPLNLGYCASESHFCDVGSTNILLRRSLQTIEQTIMSVSNRIPSSECCQRSSIFCYKLAKLHTDYAALHRQDWCSFRSAVDPQCHKGTWLHLVLYTTEVAGPHPRTDSLDGVATPGKLR